MPPRIQWSRPRLRACEPQSEKTTLESPHATIFDVKNGGASFWMMINHDNFKKMVKLLNKPIKQMVAKDFQGYIIYESTKKIQPTLHPPKKFRWFTWKPPTLKEEIQNLELSSHHQETRWSSREKFVQRCIWQTIIPCPKLCFLAVVEPTHLKNVSQNWIISPIFGVKIKETWVATTQLWYGLILGLQIWG